jgi:hypothetical protein
MPENKFALRSKTIWGAILAFIGFVGPALFGVEIDPAEIENANEMFAAAATGISGVVGFVLTIWGRFTAKGNVTATPNS